MIMANFKKLNTMISLPLLLTLAAFLSISMVEGDERIMIEPLWKRVGDLNGEKGAVESAEFSHNGKILATGEEGGMVRLWNMPEGTLLNSALNEEGTVNSIDFTSDDQSTNSIS